MLLCADLIAGKFDILDELFEIINVRSDFVLIGDLFDAELRVNVNVEFRLWRLKEVVGVRTIVACNLLAIGDGRGNEFRVCKIEYFIDLVFRLIKDVLVGANICLLAHLADLCGREAVVIRDLGDGIVQRR